MLEQQIKVLKSQRRVLVREVRELREQNQKLKNMIVASNTGVGGGGGGGGMQHTISVSPRTPNSQTGNHSVGGGSVHGSAHGGGGGGGVGGTGGGGGAGNHTIKYN